MDEAKPKAAEPDKQQPADQPEQSGEGPGNQNTAGDFEFSDLLRAHQRNLDGQRPAVPWSTPQTDRNRQ